MTHLSSAGDKVTSWHLSSLSSLTLPVRAQSVTILNTVRHALSLAQTDCHRQKTESLEVENALLRRQCLFLNEWINGLCTRMLYPGSALSIDRWKTVFMYWRQSNTLDNAHTHASTFFCRLMSQWQRKASVLSNHDWLVTKQSYFSVSDERKNKWNCKN